MTNGSPGWQIWIDRGGTFTDVIAVSPEGQLRTLKLLSDNPGSYEDAAVAAIDELLGAEELDEGPLSAVKMGTTVGTNALLERRGEPTALVITAGLRDVLRIGTQQRPDIFALDIQLPEMLYCEVVEARERLAADGTVVRPLDEALLERDLAAVRRRGVRSVAIVLLHAYRNPRHERRAQAIAKQLGFTQISVSHRVSPLMRIVPRGDTTVVDAYLTPVLERYIGQLRRGLSQRAAAATLLFMQSHGGLVAADAFAGKDCVLSGPAGGVVGMAAAAREAGFERVIGFDMGGTSTDVSLYDGQFERTTNSVLAGARIAAPMLRIHTVAAGGGSQLRFAANRLQVGPDSAGAMPGPACYRNGGPLTVTDANVLLGRIQADYFPKLFGADNDQPIDPQIVRRKFEALADSLPPSDAPPKSLEQLAAGFLRIAVERMANAIKQISVQRGHDVTAFVLSCFGGAGGQHACQVADALGIETVMIHPLAGVLSAYGMGVADLRALRLRAVEAPLDAAGLGQLVTLRSALEREALSELEVQGVGTARIERRCRLALKTTGTDSLLPLAWLPEDDAAALLARFRDLHLKHFGFEPLSEGVTIDSIEVETIGRMPKAAATPVRCNRPEAEPAALRRAWFDDAWAEVPVYERNDLPPHAVLAGPAIVVEANATTVLEPDWQARLDGSGNLLLSRARPPVERERLARGCDPVMLEVFNNLFMHIAEEMGLVLQNTAHSVNIKERLDFSCAIFDPQGELIANAPHMPVHLGSMGATVRSVLDANRGRMKRGDAFMLNAPYSGGTHLPDITVVTPVFDSEDSALRFVVANRAHHADIGGIAPGSMPATSTTIHEEGVVFDNLRLLQNGSFREAEVRAALAQPPYPARNPDQNVADLRAQVAANNKGIHELERMVERFGLGTVHAYMGHIKQNAEDAVRAAIEKLESGSYSVAMDGGERICVDVRIDQAARTAHIDFEGSSPTSPGNLNAPAAVARAAVLYAFRALVAESIPLNEGCLRPISIALPADSLVNPRYPAAVVAGNVETSQCITDALLAALDAAAASQGTMNNFTFGNARYQYYETVAGGAGAGPGFDGASAVHTHMTNSRLTDPEVIEWRFPVRVRRFEVRAQSGGQGKWHGGDGVLREIEFLEPMQGSILSNRRETVPFGLRGGGPGARGENYILRAAGTTERVGHSAEMHFEAGDRFVMKTPGGGGYGA
jgi:5-oxoprolinase (ATP-hydrolysing)